jgi:hypothetical protein
LDHAKLCNTRRMQNSLCTTRSQGVLHAAKLCNTQPMQNSLCTRGQAVLHAAKLCNTPPSCVTRCKCKICCARHGQAVLQAANAKFAVHTQPRCATRCKAMQYVAAKLCYTLQMQNLLCTGGQAVLHAAKVCYIHAAKLCNMLQMQNSLCTSSQAVQRGQAVLHAAKLCNMTRPSSATRCR